MVDVSCVVSAVGRVDKVIASDIEFCSVVLDVGVGGLLCERYSARVYATPVYSRICVPTGVPASFVSVGCRIKWNVSYPWRVV